MKTGFMISCVVGMMCMVQPVRAGDMERAEDHQALRALKDKVEMSLNGGNMDNLRTCLAKDFTFVTSDQTALTNWPDVVAYWDGMFKSEKSPVKAMTTKFTADILTQFHAPNIGYCRGTSRDVYTLKNGRKIAMTNVWSSMLVKEPDGWKIGTAHVAVNFLDNPVLAARELSWFGRMLIGLHLSKLPGEVKE